VSVVVSCHACVVRVCSRCAMVHTRQSTVSRLCRQQQLQQGHWTSRSCFARSSSASTTRSSTHCATVNRLRRHRSAMEHTSNTGYSRLLPHTLSTDMHAACLSLCLSARLCVFFFLHNPQPVAPSNIESPPRLWFEWKRTSDFTNFVA